MEYPAIYLRARDAIEEALMSRGYQPYEEHYYFHAFGSASAIYHRRTQFVALNWDGKDSCLTLDVSADNREYKTLFASPFGLQHSRLTEQELAISQVAEAARKLE